MKRRTLITIIISVVILLAAGVVYYFLTVDKTKPFGAGERVERELSPEEIVRGVLTAEQKAANPEITIVKATENHIKANLFFNPGGYYLLAARVDGEWKKVVEGNGIPACAEVEPYDFPEEIVAGCL